MEKCVYEGDDCEYKEQSGECGNVTIKNFHCMKKKEQNKERVNHPKHYQHPSGVECITVARHHDFNIGNALKYLWRAGRKSEDGMSDSQKQIEDLEKAVFYIQDEIEFLKSKQQ